MTETWTRVRVGDVAQVIGGGTPSTTTPEFWGGDIPWLSPRDLSRNPARYTYTGERNITEAGLASSSARMLPEGSVLLTSRAPIGYVTIAGQPIATNQGFKSLILDESQSPEFWYYLLGASVRVLHSVANGSTFQEISGKSLASLEFHIPSRSEQQKIAEALGALDDLIDSLSRENREIDELQRAIYIAKVRNGQSRKLGDVAQIIMGQSPPGDTYNVTGDGLPFHQGTKDFGLRFPSTRQYCSEPKRIAEPRDVLLAVRAPIGTLNVCDRRMAIGRGLAVVRSSLPSVVLQAMKSASSHWNQFEGEGTVFASIGRKEISEMPVIWPEDSELENELALLDETYLSNSRLMDSIVASRDTLVPLLLSGRVRVGDTAK